MGNRGQEGGTLDGPSKTATGGGFTPEAFAFVMASSCLESSALRSRNELALTPDAFALFLGGMVVVRKQENSARVQANHSLRVLPLLNYFWHYIQELTDGTQTLETDQVEDRADSSSHQEDVDPDNGGRCRNPVTINHSIPVLNARCTISCASGKLLRSLLGHSGGRRCGQVRVLRGCLTVSTQWSTVDVAQRVEQAIARECMHYV